MKVSLNWLKRYLSLPYTPEEISNFLTIIGLEVEGLDKIESIKGGLDGVVIGKVIECKKHPNADKLSVTKVDIGSGDLHQIVCGAPNVAAEQKVLVATVGTKIYADDDSHFTIKKGVIRGVESHGMICSASELGMSDDHSGILVLPDDAVIGTKAAEYYNIESDYVYDIGLTPNRSDATSHLGVAKDLLAYLKINKDYTDDIIEPDTSDFITERIAFNIDAEVEDKTQCPRYSGISIADIEIKESPAWLKNLLHSIGVKPINNIVDITNFVLNELGQPLHAFDADKINEKKIIVKTLVEGTPFTTLDDVKRKLHSDDLMICDGDEMPLTIAGVYGGLNSGVTDQTKNIFLESACFTPVSIRRTSTRHNLRTDAAKIFEKGSDPNMTVFALKRASALIKSLAGGAISSVITDVYPKEIKKAEVRLFYDHVNSLLGVNLSKENIHDILTSMEMEIEPWSDKSLLVKVPTNKIDVTREVDVIEEIIRIYGLNNIPIGPQIKSAISYTNKPDKHKIKELISDFLVARGFNEMMGLSLIESGHYDNLNIVHEDHFVHINNTSNIQLDIMRPEMMISGLLSVANNLNRQQNNLALFEFGKSYQQIKDKYIEKEKLTLFMSGKQHEESWLEDSKTEKSFYDIKGSVLSILDKLGIATYQIAEISSDSRLKYGLKLHRGPMILVEFGEIRKAVLSSLGIKTKVFYAEFSIEDILKATNDGKIHIQPISKFPSVRRDLAMTVSKEVRFADIEKIAKSVEKDLLKQISLFDVYENEKQLGEGNKSFAISFMFEAKDTTLKDVEINKIMDDIMTQIEKKTGAVIRK